MRLRSHLIWTAYLAIVVAAVIVLVASHGEAHPVKLGEQAQVLQGGGSILTPQGANSSWENRPGVWPGA